jgi:hypothetical protein
MAKHNKGGKVRRKTPRTATPVAALPSLLDYCGAAGAL